MKEKKLLKMQSLIILSVMISQILLPIYPLNTISKAEESDEQEVTRAEIGDNYWNIGKNEQSNIIAHMEATTLYINGTGEMKDFQDIKDIPWYSKREYITELIIENGITNIGQNILYECTGLEEITIPESIENIRSDTFIYCDNLISINVGENNNNFSNDENGVLFNKDKTTLVCYPKGKETANYAIPETVTSVGSYAIYGCEALTEISIHEGVTYIGTEAFNSCNNLNNIIVSENNENYLDEDGVLYNKSKTILIKYPCEKQDENYTIPSSVISIENGAFDNCEYLTEVILQNGIENIGDAAFRNCQRIANLTIPNTVTNIGKEAFLECNSIDNVTIPDGVTIINEKIFKRCNSLSSIEIYGDITSIGAGAFAECPNLRSIEIPNSVETIEKEAFYNCTALREINLPEGITTIEDRTFYSCRMLLEIEIPNSVTTIGEEAFSKAGLANVEIPNSVTHIGKNAFYECQNLSEISFEEGGNCTIGESAFYCCGLTNLVISDSAKSIGDRAFDQCVDLTSVTISSGVESIGEGIFDHDLFITSITVDENNEYYSNDENGVLFNKDKTTLVCYPKGKSETSYTIPNGVKNIAGEAFFCCENLQRVDLNEVENIGDRAFSLCSNLESLSNTNNLKSMGEEAFDWCYNLTDITLPSCFQSIGKNAFNNCWALTEIIVDENNENYSSENGVLFNKDKTILIRYPNSKEDTIYNIPEEVVHIEEQAFKRCLNLTKIFMADNVTSIGEAAFTECSELIEVKLSENLTTIEDSIFYDCKKLSTVNIPKNITSIGGCVFSQCYPITSIVIPSKVTTIKNFASWGINTINKIVVLSNNLDGLGNQYIFGGQHQTVYYNGDTDAAKMIERYKEMTNCDATFIPAIWNIGATEEENVVAKIIVEDDEVILQITGTGEMLDFVDYEEIPWYDAYHDLITKIEIEEGITNIGDNAFGDCPGLEEITVPSTVETIGENAFDTDEDDQITIYYYPDNDAMQEYISNHQDEANYAAIVLVSITADDTELNKKKYKVGESLDLTGLKIVKTYSDGSTEEITEGFTTENGFTIEPTDLQNANNEQQIQISYEENGVTVNTSFVIEVIGVKTITADISNMNTTYTVGDTIDLNGLVITATYTDDFTTEVITDYEVRPTVLNTAGEQTITIIYNGQETTFTVNVEEVEPTIQEIVINNNPKTEYTIGDILDLSGLELLITYSDETTQEITEGFTSDPEDGTILNTIGEQTVTITYNGKTVSFIITVNDETLPNILKDESTYEEDRVYVKNVPLKTSIEEFLSNFNTAYEIELNDINAEYIGTGREATVKRIKNSTLNTICVLKVIVLGDVTGDGQADLSDIFEINKVRLNTLTFEGAKEKAADMNNDSKINFYDILLVNNLRISAD